jgi:hypothetical protein
MPLLAALLKAILGGMFSFIVAAIGANLARKVAGIAALATLYFGGLVAFSAVVAPLFGAVFNTQYGQVIGLLFPPVAGTVMVSLAVFWAALMTKRYLVSITKLAAS